jgi:hypothetical protein
VSDNDVRRALRAVPLKGEAEAEERSWELVRAAWAAREKVPWARRHRGLVGAVAAATLVAAAVLFAVLTPPGQAVVDRFRDAVGRSQTEPALVRLPTSGRLLVLSSAGPWVVHEDGSKRLLGDYGDAAWSPRGLYVVAAQDQHLVALDADTGDVRWSLARTLPASDPSWSGGGLDTRIAYRAGSELHVVAGDGSPDELVARGTAPVAAAWRGDSHVLAYADEKGRVHLFDADAGHELGRTPRGPRVRQIGFDPAGRLVVATAKEILVYRRTLRGEPHQFARAPADHEILGFATEGYGIVYADYDRAKNETTLVRPACSTAGACLLILNPDTSLLRGAGRVDGLVLSPDNRWLVSGWPDADQLLFFRLAPRVGKIVDVSNATGEFSPGGSAGSSFPVVAGWVE